MMSTESGPTTRGRLESRKEFDSYLQSEAFEILVNKTVSEQFERFLSSQEFKNLLVTTTKSVVSTVLQEAVHDTIAKEIQEKVEPLKKQIKDLSDDLDKVRKHANENEQYSRRCNVRIYGIPENEGENCYELVSDFCKQDLHCELEERDIDRIHRVGKLRVGSPRALIVKFCSYQIKAKVMKSRRQLKGKSLFINEDLTAVNKRLFDAARTQLTNLSVWTSDGKVLVRLQNDHIVRIKSKDDIERYNTEAE